MKKTSFIDKKIGQIQDSYNKQLLTLHEINFKAGDINLEYFVTYLKYLRDYYILTSKIDLSNKLDMKITSLIAAVAEYEEYMSCINKYYNIGTTIVRKNQEETEEQVMKKYGAEKMLHWQKFWQFVSLNIERWVANNA